MKMYSLALLLLLPVLCLAASSSVPSSPEEAAEALARALAEGRGALLPGREPPREDGGEILLPADGGAWPVEFLDGLVPVRRFGTDVYPFEVRMDDSTGDAVFRNALQEEFFRVEPRPDAPTNWLSLLLWTESAPWTRPSHLVEAWSLVPEANSAAFFASRDALAAEASAARALLSRTGSPPAPVTNLVFTGIFPGDGTTALSFTWPAGILHSGSQIGLYAKARLSDPNWTRVRGWPVEPGVTNGSWVVTNSLLPGWTAPETHNAACIAVTNAVPAPFGTGTVQTVRWLCGHSPVRESCFFLAAADYLAGSDEEEEDPPAGPPGIHVPFCPVPATSVWLRVSSNPPTRSSHPAARSFNTPTRSPRVLEDGITVPAGTSTLLVVFAHSEEYPEWTGQSSTYNDTMSWNVTVGNASVLSGQRNVNALHSQWAMAAADGWTVLDLEPPVIPLDAVLVSTPTNASLEATVVLSVENIGDDTLATTLCVGAFPLRVRQINAPTSVTATDSGEREVREIAAGEVAYVTGDPAAPALRAWFDGLPDFVDTGWRMTLRTERPERNTLDDRDIPGTGWIWRPGDEVFDMESALHEIIGGKVSLYARAVGRDHGPFEFFIRGKNPKDEDVESFIDENFDLVFLPYVRAMIRHETRQTPYIYNQFNSRTNLFEQLNWGYPDGWGLGQIDRSSSKEIVQSDEAWNWQTNLLSMNLILRQKRNDQQRFVGYYRELYGNHPNWIEPPQTYDTWNPPLSYIDWGTIILYNGATNIPAVARSPGSTPGSFRSPAHFILGQKMWIVRDNGHNYARKIRNEMNRTDSPQD